MVSDPPVRIDWRDASTPQSISYGYQAPRHTNRALTDPYWNFDVGYITAPARFLGNKRGYYRGELSSWYEPDERMYGEAMGTTRHCWTHWIL